MKKVSIQTKIAVCCTSCPEILYQGHLSNATSRKANFFDINFLYCIRGEGKEKRSGLSMLVLDRSIINGFRLQF